MKILIITAFFPPLNSIASLRPYSWAKHWSKLGHDVSVLTIPQRPSATDSPMPCDGINIIEVPIPGLSLLLKIFGKGGSNGRSEESAGAARKGGLGLKEKVRRWQQAIQLRTGILSSCRMPDLLDLWGGAAFNKVKSEEWDLVISTAGPYSVHGPAHALRSSGRAKKWIADWRDLWVDNHIFPGLPIFRTIERSLERRWSRRADLITTVSPPLAELLIEKYGKKVQVIYNGFDADDYSNLPSEKIFPNDNVVRIVYTGTIYSENHDPQPLFQAIAELTAAGKIDAGQLQVVFCGRNTDLSEAASRAGISEFVSCRGLVPREDALRMQRDATALLFFEFQSDRVQGILSGKIFEYLFAGPFILSLGGSSKSSVAKLLSEARRGLSLGSDVEKIKNELLRLKGKLPSDVDLQNAEAVDLDFYSRRVQAAKILELIRLN